MLEVCEKEMNLLANEREALLNEYISDQGSYNFTLMMGMLGVGSANFFFSVNLVP